MVMKYKFVKRIKELKKLEANWDGYEAKPIPKAVWDKLTHEFVDSIEEKFLAIGFNLDDISLMPLAYGGLQFEAEKEIDGIDTYLEMEVKE
jgi:hypothetical protein